MFEINGEMWATIPGFPGYLISDQGKVVSMKKTNKNQGKPLLMAFQVNNTGHYYLMLYTADIVRKKCYVHKLVSAAFVPNPLGLPHINHIDGNKLNNHHKNLQPCTHQQNMDHAWATGLCRRGTQHQHYNPTEYTFKHPDHGTFKGSQLIFRETYKLTPVNVYKLATGRTQEHRGWRLV